ncbi:MAG: Imm70 family immunity protein [Christensenellales bacterium]|jgi:hypothetical protein
MTIVTSDGRQSVDVGNADIWRALVSTILVRLPKKEKELRQAVRFLQSGKCEAKDGLETARSMNLVRDALSQIGPEKMVYDASDFTKTAPWGTDISPAITSCANYFTTADGKDLLSELVGILIYAFYAKVDVEGM